MKLYTVTVFFASGAVAYVIAAINPFKAICEVLSDLHSIPAQFAIVCKPEAA
ncbi:MAG: hypothetical protein WC825_02310 [Gallionellaceae bacterium]|jgi:hypothetical protein